MDMMHVVSEEKETPRKKILNNGQDCWTVGLWIQTKLILLV